MNSCVMNVCDPSCPLLCLNGSGSISVSHHLGILNASTVFADTLKPPSSWMIFSPDLINTGCDFAPCERTTLILSPYHSALSADLKAPFHLTSTGNERPVLVLKKADSFQNGLL